MPTRWDPLGKTGAIAAVVAGALLTAVAAAFALIVLLLTSFGCEGTDVSSPPEPGSTDARLCGWPKDTAYAVLLPLAVVAPLAGGIWAAAVRRIRPLAAGCAASAGALLLPAWFAGRVESATGLLLLPTLAVFVVAVVLARRAG